MLVKHPRPGFLLPFLSFQMQNCMKDKTLKQICNRNYTRPCILLFIFSFVEPTIFILKLWYIKEHLFVPIVAKIWHLNSVIQVGKLHIQPDIKREDVGYKAQLLCACISLDVLFRNYKRQLVMSNKWPKTDRDCDFLTSTCILLPGYRKLLLWPDFSCKVYIKNGSRRFWVLFSLL